MTSDLKIVAAGRAQQALRLASASLPHLGGLSRLMRIKATRRVSVAAIGPSGLILVNPDVFAHAPLGDAAFVLAHEMMHLALNTHGREGDADHLIANFAHDYIINDMLANELERPPPLNGLYEENASQRSFEEWIIELSQSADGQMRCWSGGGKRRQKGDSGRGPMQTAMEEAGLVPKQEPETIERPDPRLMRGDVLPEDREPEMEPEIGPELRKRLIDQVRAAAAKAASLSELKKQMDANSDLGANLVPQRGEQMMKAIRGAYDTPWELALQRWMDAVAPGQRTYARPSRRGSLRRDVVLPGRERRGWTLHILLDTSGSMVDILPKALGAIASFCDASDVSDVHVVQCDIEVTRDDWLEPARLNEYEIGGFGYSDMAPGMHHLGKDPEVEAALVLTDGYIDYPAQEVPYRVLWGLIGQYDTNFKPRYGDVVKIKL